MLKDKPDHHPIYLDVTSFKLKLDNSKLGSTQQQKI